MNLFAADGSPCMSTGSRLLNVLKPLLQSLVAAVYCMRKNVCSSSVEMERGRTDLGPRWQMLTRIDLESRIWEICLWIKAPNIWFSTILRYYFRLHHTSNNSLLSSQSHGQVLFSEIPHMHWIPCEKDKVPWDLRQSKISGDFAFSPVKCRACNGKFCCPVKSTCFYNKMSKASDE